MALKPMLFKLPRECILHYLSVYPFFIKWIVQTRPNPPCLIPVTNRSIEIRNTCKDSKPLKSKLKFLQILVHCYLILPTYQYLLYDYCYPANMAQYPVFKEFTVYLGRCDTYENSGKCKTVKILSYKLVLSRVPERSNSTLYLIWLERLQVGTGE